MMQTTSSPNSIYNCDQNVLAQQFTEQRSELRRMVRGRIGLALQRRLDVSDIVQDVYVEASSTLSGFIRNPTLSVSRWLKALTWQRMKYVLRANFVAERRSLTKEVHTTHNDDSYCVVSNQPAMQSSVGSRIVRFETGEHIRAALAKLESGDCQILRLRVFEGMSNKATAEVLGIECAAATKRYVRALGRLGDVMRENGWSSDQ